MVLLILSLVIGTWYMQSTGDVQTAWTISSYSVTAAGGMFRTFCGVCPDECSILIALTVAATSFGSV